jgi:hypothetical protein
MAAAAAGICKPSVLIKSGLIPLFILELKKIPKGDVRLEDP